MARNGRVVRSFAAGREVVYQRADLVVSPTGLDDGLSQTVHARHGSAAEAIRWNARLVDILRTEPDGTRVLDHRRFHEVEPLP